MERKTSRWVKLLVFLQLIFIALLIFTIVRDADPITPRVIARQGSPGVAGQSIKGSDGYTPIKGLDYFDGRDGTNGKDGESVVGPQGPGPTDEQIASAVANYCATNTCTGERGEPGEPGSPARSEEQRCVVVNGQAQMQHRYEDDDGWTTLYYLPEGSSCS